MRARPDVPQLFDGRGVPDGLAGDAIPREARIACVADAFDAMMSGRPYRRAQLTLDDALAELRKHSGTQFDPELVDIFIRLYSAKPPVADHALVVRAIQRRARTKSVPGRASA